MSTLPAPFPDRATGGAHQAALLGVGFAAAVGLRVALGGLGPARSVPAGLAFAGVLAAMSAARGVGRPRALPAVCWGVAGGAMLCAPALASRLGGAAAHRPGGTFAAWAAVVAIVATAEEVFLRGALFDAVSDRTPAWVAVATTAVAFAALHVPLYGWHVAPGDFAVGLWLGAVRMASGSWAAPVIAHAGADLAGWWLR